MAVTLSDTQAMWFRKFIDLLKEAQGGPAAPGDDIARSIVEELDCILAKQGHPSGARDA